MPSALTFLMAIFAFAAMSCATGSPKGMTIDDSAYDGTADSMDSLPDCIPELEGSSFWVKDKKGAYDCSASGEWKNRKSAKMPDNLDDSEEEAGAWTPRMIEK
ncbi:MAG: hypothetical protein H7318_03580 [Oligoflexus sp.]|nr:hypothetical protein [Oligoflexus sp.]